MKDKDKEEFEKWYKKLSVKSGKLTAFDDVWQAACEYKQKEIDELKLEIVQVKGDRNKAEFELAVAVERLDK